MSGGEIFNVEKLQDFTFDIDSDKLINNNLIEEEK